MLSVLKFGLWAQATCLILGMILHTSAVITGHKYFYEKIFIPETDVVFFILISLGGTLAFLGQVRNRYKNIKLWIGSLFVSIYFLISIPVHAKTMITWSTDHFKIFPEIYSLFILPIQGIFLLIVFFELKYLKEGSH
ncbi:MAG TPA: hypothetical protein PK079_05135 [Leptospiraceae bacterium]|nr:hypothetical protein [Leptospiraceae bacterium]HMW06255.1 hypothetical protein [Leptospiraceae bacterium]HMX33184.1 hypothetical protein [Leptospiraceae bacterium]HMY31717.1 hypothetical protein [Leptospiraceae bacterium]HMZ64510.1 hypothetical protein [Leptospiraceae bacterium]